MIRKLLKNTILIVNLIAIICLMVSGVSHYASPAEHPLLGIMGLLFPAFILINLGFTVWWIILRKMFFLLSLFSLLIFVNRITDIFHVNAKNNNPVSYNSFKILSYNVRVFGLYDWKNNSKIRDSIFAFIRSESPQIACFQEYYNQSDTIFPVEDSLIKHQSFKHTHIHYTSIHNKSHMFGIATYSIFPIINKGVIPFKNTSNLAIYSDILIDSDTIRVYNCHLESVRFNTIEYKFIDDPASTDNKGIRKGITNVIKRMRDGFNRRAAQADEINRQIALSPYPVILCGDFNDTPSSYVYHKLRDGLKDSHRQKGHGLGLTYNRIFTGFRIDYILYSDRFECVDFNVPRFDFSDHRPVVGNYIIK